MKDSCYSGVPVLSSQNADILSSALGQWQLCGPSSVFRSSILPWVLSVWNEISDDAPQALHKEEQPNNLIEMHCDWRTKNCSRWFWMKLSWRHLLSQGQKRKTHVIQNCHIVCSSCQRERITAARHNGNTDLYYVICGDLTLNWI